MGMFKINGKEYKSKTFDFNLMCDLEDAGLSMEDIAAKPMSMIRKYFAMCAGKSVDYAGKQIQEHIVNGGTLDDFVTVMQEEIKNSDFFQKANQTKETETVEET